MKKWIFSIVAFGALSSVAFFASERFNQGELTLVQLANIEALANGDVNSRDRIPYWSASTIDVNQSYFDCADSTSIEWWKGTKTQAYCTRR